MPIKTLAAGTQRLAVYLFLGRREEARKVGRKKEKGENLEKRWGGAGLGG